MAKYAEDSLFCARCGDFRLHRQQRISWLVAVLVGFFSLVLLHVVFGVLGTLAWFVFVVGWTVTKLSKTQPWRCASCGSAYDAKSSHRVRVEKLEHG
jgi:hypothetical protein